MSTTANTVLTDEEIDAVVCAGPAWDNQPHDIARRIERAVIERLGASDAVPTIWLSERYIGTKVDGEEMYQRPDFTTEQPPSTNRNIRPLYDATALARARQQGYGAARAEFGPDAERLDWLEEQAKESRSGVGFDWRPAYAEGGLVLESKGWRFMRHRFLGDRKPSIREAIDAVRQPTQKETGHAE